MFRMDSIKFTEMMKSFGITDPAFILPLFTHLNNVDRFGGDGVEFAAAVIKGAQPKDQFMAMQAAQMAMMHWCAMRYMEKVAAWRNSDKQDQLLAVNMATKLARTFSAQLDAMKRYRNGGEQRVTVHHQHVSVTDGSNAIVAQSLDKPAEKAPALSDSRESALKTDPVQQWVEYVERTKSSSP